MLFVSWDVALCGICIWRKPCLLVPPVSSMLVAVVNLANQMKSVGRYGRIQKFHASVTGRTCRRRAEDEWFASECRRPSRQSGVSTNRSLQHTESDWSTSYAVVPDPPFPRPGDSSETSRSPTNGRHRRPSRCTPELQYENNTKSSRRAQPPPGANYNYNYRPKKWGNGTLRTQGMSDPRHFGSIKFATKCLD